MSLVPLADPEMLQLKYGGVWMGLGWVLVVSVMLGSLLPSPTISVFVLDDKLVHFGSYFLLMAWFSGMYHRKRDYAAIAVILIVLGLGLDYLQRFTSTRYFDAYDILANIIGTGAGFGFAIALIGGWCLRVERLMSKELRR